MLKRSLEKMAPETKVIWALGSAVVLIAGWFVGGLIVWGYRLENPRVLETIKFDDDIKLELIIQADVDVENTLSYRILDGDTEVASRRSLGIYKRRDDYELVRFQDASGSLLGVHSVEPFGMGEPLLVIFDKESEESWPRLADGELASDPDVRRKWLSRFYQIQSNHPELPKTQYFSEQNLE